MPEDHANGGKGQIPTNMRLLLVLEEVAKAGAPVAPAVIADALQLPKPTVHRLLSTAEDEGFLKRDVDGRSFGPGQRLRHLSGNTLSSQRIRTERLLIMQALEKTVGETCNLAAPGRFGMVYLDRVETHWPLRIQLPVGTQVPFHCTASGKLYLSSLRREKLERLLNAIPLERMTGRTITNPDELMAEVSDVRARSFSTDDQEFMDGMTAVGVPINDNQGRLLTTLSIHAPIQRQSRESLMKALPELRAAASKLEDLCND